MNALFQLKKRFLRFGFLTPRGLVTLLLCGTACLTVTGTLPAFFRPEVQTKVSHPAAAGLTFAERVAYQRIIEDVYWRHRVWPKENPDPKPSLDAVMSQAQLEKKVTDYLQKSRELEDYWQQPITADQLQAEMNRMAQHTRQAEVLRELFAALGNDPFVIAECLARPLLAERLLMQSGSDQLKHISLSAEQVVAATANYRLPLVFDDGGCTDDTWTATSTANAPDARTGHTAVWTGSEMIVWGGYCGDFFCSLGTGGRYNPSTDSWTTTSTAGAPSPRRGHTAVWTGTQMIIWGGDCDYDYCSFNTGGRYNPGTDSWIATSTAGAPSARSEHTAVWTGSEMIVWGGDDFRTFFNTGGRYNPNTNSWTNTSTTNPAAARFLHTAVWTGSEMIIWGGSYRGSRGNYINLNNGRRYNPGTNSWTAMTITNAPSARSQHTAVWDDSEMIVWGGTTPHSTGLNTGGRYNPSANSWTATSTTNAPAGRCDHSAVWTGSEMIVWGGLVYGNNPTSTGGRYCAYVAPQLSNISTRAFVQTGDNVMIGGFIVQGPTPKRVIIRAIGPELTQYGVPNAMSNPILELHDGTGALIASNDNWVTTIIGGIITTDQVADVRASGYAPGDGRESAIIADLPAGNYTVIVRGVNNITGVGLVEVYDLSGDASSILGNISTRSFVQTGDNVMIGGFILTGAEPKRVIVRAIGPELTQYGVPNALTNPTLELHDNTGALIASNDNWQHTIIGGIITSDQVHEIMDSGHAPTDPMESAIIATLSPGNYTAIVRGVNNTTGVALVDVYDLDQ